MMYSSLVSHLPVFVAYSVSFLVDYSGLIGVGLYIEIAALRVYAVVSVSKFSKGSKDWAI